MPNRPRRKTEARRVYCRPIVTGIWIVLHALGQSSLRSTELELDDIRAKQYKEWTRWGFLQILAVHPGTAQRRLFGVPAIAECFFGGFAIDDWCMLLAGLYRIQRLYGRGG